jgi:hypothetical protein
MADQLEGPKLELEGRNQPYTKPTQGDCSVLG